jgi:voltage-gated potassium channel Kch
MSQPAHPVKISWIDRLRYRLNQQFSRHPAVLIFWLGLLSIAVIILIGVVLYLTGMAPGDEEPYPLIEALWVGFLQVMGGGIGGRETVWPYRLMMLGVMLFNLFLFSIVIGALTSGFQNRLEELRRGRTIVVEKGHTVILGWSEQVFTILTELVRANASQPRSCIVILGDQDKTTMEGEIRSKVGDTGKVRIVCRTGNPLEMTDLGLVSVNTSKNIIVLPPVSDRPDPEVIKIILALRNNPHRRQEPYRIVAPLREKKNMAVARVLGQDEVEWLIQGEIISHIIAQTSLQSGLSVVYTELFDYSGSEIYLYNEPKFCGLTFAEALNAGEEVTIIGLRQAGQKPRLSPPFDTAIRTNDQVIVIAQDDSSIMLNPDRQVTIHAEAIQPDTPQEQPRHAHILVLGWNLRGPTILQELDRYVAPESTITVVANPELTDFDINRDCQDLANLRACYRAGDTTDAELLATLGLDEYDHIIMLAYSEKLSIQYSDALTLISLLHVRDQVKDSPHECTIVTEMLDLRNRNLAQSDRPEDFIVSDRLISLMLAQVAETRGICTIYDDLFDPAEGELYLKPADRYLVPGSKTNFATVVVAAARLGEIAIGYRLASQHQDASQNFGIVINPAKSTELVFNEMDQVIVLAKS